MKKHICISGLLLAAAIALQGCAHSVKDPAQDDAWQNCRETAGQKCPNKELTGNTAKNLFDALITAGVEERQLMDLRTISVHWTACSNTDGKYDCSLKYHKPSSDLTPEIAIKDGNAAKLIYQALAAAGAREDLSGPSRQITITSIGCMAEPPRCILAKNAYEEVAW